MARNRMMMLHLIIMLLLAAFLYPGFREEVKASGAEDPITLPIDGILCHQQAGELFDEINEERRNRGIQELVWDSGYESIVGIRSIETSVYFSHLLPSAEEELSGPRRQRRPSSISPSAAPASNRTRGSGLKPRAR